MPSYVVRARYDEPDGPEEARCITTEEISDEAVALATAEGLARDATTDVVLLVRGEVASVIVLKGVEWFSIAMLDREHPGWRLDDASSLPRVLQFPSQGRYIHAIHRLMSWTDEGVLESVEAVVWRHAAPESEPRPEGENAEGTASPVAA